MNWRILLLVPASLVVSGWAVGRDLDPSKYSSNIRRFVEDVVYTVDVGDRDEHFIKLPGDVTVRCHGTAEQAALVDGKCGQFAQATGVTMTMAAADAAVSAGACTIDVYFGPTASLESVGRDQQVQIALQPGSNYWKWWTDQHVVKRAIILICTDKVHGVEVADRLVEHLFAVFGMPARSPVAGNSCLHTEDACQSDLLPLDKEALAFLYQYVPAGTKPAELRKLVRDHWEK